MTAKKLNSLTRSLAPALLLMISGCAVSSDPSPPSAPDIRQVAPAQAQRLYRIMTPLLKAMDNPKNPQQVYIGIMDDPGINAANAGGAQFYVTRGLLQKASDQQLRGIMAHEIAHEDLGHVAKLQTLGLGLNLGVILLEELLPGSSAVTPIAGGLIARGYSRGEENAADRHAVDILNRAGYSKTDLINGLEWVERESGGGTGGGFLSTHPATADRIEALKRLR
ncbi:MAG TPA: M48 family metallopeptidase [Candidatus Udaeobacter sp.]|jgi:predicted Zn-dependent protease|nr:M48 family metallopeptidase [Candidatus Udaeobacter sp.]